MRLDRFIASRLQFSHQASFTRVIVRVAIVAVAASLGIIILSSSLIKGFKEEIRDKVFGFWGHIHITHIDSDRSVEAIPVDLDRSLLDSISGTGPVEYYPVGGGGAAMTGGGVEHVQKFIALPAFLNRDDVFEGVVLKGVGPDFRWNAMEEWLVEGELLDASMPDSALEDNDKGLLLSKYLADRMQLDVGDRFLVIFIRKGQQLKRRFQLKGIFNTGLQEYDRHFALTDYRHLQQVLGWDKDQFSGLEVFLENIEDIGPINDHLYMELLPPSLYSETIRSRFPAIFEWLELQDINEWVLLIILLTVAFINMVTVLIILILERTRMIGLLKAIGSPDGTIRLIFLRLALKILVYGILFGNAFALLLGWLQQKYRLVTLHEADYYLSYAPVHFDFVKILAINAGAAVVILLFLLLPAMLVNRIDPVKALRFS